MRYRIPDWEEFQIYKDRRPPWICLHRTLIDNRKFQSLPLNARAMLPMLWLLASENKDFRSGIIDLTAEDIAYRLRVKLDEVQKCVDILLSSCFLEVVRFDTKMYENVPIDIAEQSKDKDRKPKSIIECPEGVSQQVFDDFIAIRKAKKLPLTKTAMDGIASEAAKACMTLEGVFRECCNRGWGGFKAEWVKDKDRYGKPSKPVEHKSNVKQLAGQQ